MNSRILVCSLFLVSLLAVSSSPGSSVVNDVDADDPAYKMYKEGYELVLDERWQEAAGKFNQVLQQHPESRYIEDVQFWSAYILAHSKKSPQKAIQAYSAFLTKYPGSKYIDEVVADLAELKGNYILVQGGRSPSREQSVTVTLTDSTGPEDSDLIILESDGEKSIQKISRTRVKELTRTIQIDTRRIGEIARIVTKIENDTATGRNKIVVRSHTLEVNPKEADGSYYALKGVVLDARQPREHRLDALYKLAVFPKVNVVPVFLDVVRLDTCPEVQVVALDNIRDRMKDKEQAVTVLEDLFRSLRKEQVEQRQMVFYSIADIGNDRAVDFLADIAQSQHYADLRGDAIYYLGSIGSEKARKALTIILQGK